MQKISDSTNTADSAGEFTEGNPVGGIPATQIKANWLNSVQRELINLLKRAGLTPDVKKDDQVADAISQIVSSATEFENIRGKPTTLSGYGITDAYTQIQVNDLLDNKASRSATLAGYGITDAYTQTQVNSLLGAKASKANTLSGYGIADAYTRAQVDGLLGDKASRATTLSGYGIVDAYTQTQLNGLLASKANNTDVYSKPAIIDLLAAKANKASSLAGYGITDAIPNVNPLPSGSYDLHGTTYAFVSSPLESSVCQNAYWDGSAWKKHDTSKASVSLSASGGQVFVRTWPVGAQTYASARILDTTMEAAVPELDAGVTPAKWVSVAGLAYYVSSKIKAASETIIGICRFATLAEVVAGTSGYLAVAPAYLAAGFSYNFGANGFIKLPTWLGGVMAQWAYSDESNSATDYRYFPVPFPTSIFGSWLQLEVGTINGFGGSYGTIVQLVDNSRYLWTAGGTFGGGGKGWILALGR